MDVHRLPRAAVAFLLYHRCQHCRRSTLHYQVCAVEQLLPHLQLLAEDAPQLHLLQLLAEDAQLLHPLIPVEDVVVQPLLLHHHLRQRVEEVHRTADQLELHLQRQLLEIVMFQPDEALHAF